MLLLFFLPASGTGDKTTKVVTAASKVGIWGVMVAVAVVASICKSVTVGTIQQPGVGLGRSICISLSGCLPLLPAVVAVVVAKAIVAVVTCVGVRSVAVGKVAVAMGPVAVGAVEIPGIGLSFRIGFRLGLSFPLLPCLLHSRLLSSGSSSVDDRSVGVGHDGGRCCGIGEGSPVGVGKVV